MDRWIDDLERDSVAGAGGGTALVFAIDEGECVIRKIWWR
jgi:hypothetical protein